MCGAGFKDVFCDGGGADEGDGFDRGVAQDGIHSFPSAVDEVEHSVGQTGFLRELRNAHRGEWNFLARFEDECVSTGDGHGPHPKRHHGGKVKRGDTRDNAKRLADGIAVDAAGDILEGFAHEEGRRAAGEFDVLESAADLATCFGQRFAVFAGHALRKLLEMVLQQDLKLHQNPRALDGRGFHPLRVSISRGADGLVDNISTAERGFGDDFADGWIVDGGGGDAGDVRPIAADEQRNGQDFAHKSQGWAGMGCISPLARRAW